MGTIIKDNQQIWPTSEMSNNGSPFVSSITKACDTADNEIFFLAKTTSNCPTREPWQSDPVVTTLHNRKVHEGDTTILAAEYDAKPPVTLHWQRNKQYVYEASNCPRRGQTQMIINGVGHQHHKNKYRVLVSDSSGRQAFSSATIKLEDSSDSESD